MLPYKNIWIGLWIISIWILFFIAWYYFFYWKPLVDSEYCRYSKERILISVFGSKLSFDSLSSEDIGELSRLISQKYKNALRVEDKSATISSSVMIETPEWKLNYYLDILKNDPEMKKFTFAINHFGWCIEPA